MSKLALERAVALQAQALAPAVRVCGVAPGILFASGPQTEANFAQAARANLLRRADRPGRRRHEPASSWPSTPSVTGTTLCVDNGQHLVPLPRDIMFVVDDLLKANLHHDQPAALDPLLLVCRRVFLRDYEVWINIGVHEFEKRAEQRVIINVDLYVPLDVSTPKADELDEVVDYDFIRRTRRHAPEQGPHPPAGNAVRRHRSTQCWRIPRCRPRACRPPSPMCIPTAMRSASKSSGASEMSAVWIDETPSSDAEQR